MPKPEQVKSIQQNFLHEGSVLRWNVHFGFNTWNISIAHDMQPWATFNASNKEFNMKFTKIGLIFYIL